MSPAAHPPITREQLAGQSPEMQVLIRAIVDQYERRIAALAAEVKALKKSPQNSAVMSNSRAARFASSACEVRATEREVEAAARRATSATRVPSVFDPVAETRSDTAAPSAIHSARC